MAQVFSGNNLDPAWGRDIDDRVELLETTALVSGGTVRTATLTVDYTKGSSSASTDASGQVVIAHGLGTTPGQVIITSTSGAVFGHTLSVRSRSSTTFTVQVYYNNNTTGEQKQIMTGTGSGVSSSSFPFDWIAFK